MDRKTNIEQANSDVVAKPATDPILRSIFRVLVVIALILGSQVIYFARDLIMPLVLGLLLAITLSPVVRTLGNYRVPAPLVSVLLIAIAGLILALGAYSVSDSLSDMIDSAPKVKEKIEAQLVDHKKPIDAVKQTSDQIGTLIESINGDKSQTVAVEKSSFITAAATSFAASASTFGIALFMALFMLATGTLFHEKLLDLMPKLSEKKQALSAVYDIENQVSRYLLTITMINAGLGVVIAIVMALLQVPNPIVWGIVAMVLNYLPFVGAMVGAVAVGLVSVTTFDSIGPALLAPLFYYVCTLIEGSVITPLIIGHQMSLNIVAVFLSVTIWGWLWGIPGMLMAVPLLVVTKVICNHIEGWGAFGHFLTGRLDKP